MAHDMYIKAGHLHMQLNNDLDDMRSGLAVQTRWGHSVTIISLTQSVCVSLQLELQIKELEADQEALSTFHWQHKSDLAALKQAISVLET